MPHGILEVFLGSEKHPKPWLEPTPVKLLPTLKERQDFSGFERAQRSTFFFLFFGGFTMVMAVILQLMVFFYNRYRSKQCASEMEDTQDERYVLLTPTAPTPVATKVAQVVYGKAASVILEGKRAFEAIDIWFTWYRSIYQVFCGGLVLLALRHDYIDIDFGMDFELYVPWLIEALIAHFFCMVLNVWYNINGEQTPDEKLPSPFMKTITSVAPFLSERFNLLRDWVTIGIYLTDGHPIAKVSAAIVFLSICWVESVLFSQPKLLSSTRINYWPLAKEIMLRDDDSVVAYNHQVLRHYRKMRVELEADFARSSEQHRCEQQQRMPMLRASFRRVPTGWLMHLQMKLACEMDMATQEHKVVSTLYGEIPQGVGAVLFVAFGRWSDFVIMCLFLYVSKVILLIVIRPYVLCYLADQSFPWKALKARDIERIMHSRKSFAFFVPWQRLALAALETVKELKEGPDVAVAAVDGIGRLLTEVDDDQSASLIAHYINMLREMHNELPATESTPGVKMFRKALVQNIMRACEGIEEKDVSAEPILSGGNLGYFPSGGDLLTLDQMVKTIHEGEHDVAKLLKEYGAWKQHRLPLACDSKEDLVVFLTDLEPDDVMAVAQLWQWKLETLRMATEPIVVFGADFADKDAGTVFEKKILVAHLMLGISRILVLTPAPSFYAEADDKLKAKTHPLASHWEAKRNTELEEVCKKLREFEGSHIHLYVMAPGKGNIDGVLRNLKSCGVFPSDKSWRIQLYSGAFNMRGMSAEDLAAIKEIASHSDCPLLDAAKFPFFGGKHYHPWTSSFTTFAPDKFPVELNLVAHPLVPAGLKRFNDEHNMGLVAPHKLHKQKAKLLTRREKERLEAVKSLYKVETITEMCKALMDDFSVFSKIDDFKKSIVSAFAFGACDSPLADQLIFLEEYLMDRHPDKLSFAEHSGEWVVSKEGHTSVDLNGNVEASCHAIQPVLADPLNERDLKLCRDKLQEYLLKHLQALQFCEGDSAGEATFGATRSRRTMNIKKRVSTSSSRKSVIKMF